MSKEYLNRELVEQEIARRLFPIADAMIRYMEDDGAIIPVDTHNLKDALGVAIYIDGRLQHLGTSSRTMPKKATEPRRNFAIGGVKYIEAYGSDLISELIHEGLDKYSQGMWLVLLSAMPYDYVQDDRGVNKGWFSVHLSSKFRAIIEEVIHQYGDK